MSFALLLAVSVTVSNVTNDCPTCSATGRVVLPCPDCKGKGIIRTVRRGGNYGGLWLDNPCRKCAGKGLVGPRQKSSGVVDVKCPICNGRKKVSYEVLKTVLNRQEKK